MNQPVRIGIVGAGRILPAHLKGYQLLRQAGVDTFRVTGLTSHTRRDAESYVDRHAGPAPRPPVSLAPSDPLSVSDVFVSDFQDDTDVTVFDSLAEMLAADNVDALDITATLPVHHAAGQAALRVRKHCMVQKPLAISVRAGRLLVEEARRAGASLGVMENLRYARQARIARWLIDRGYLGEVQMIAAWSIGTLEWSPDRVVADTPWRHKKVLAGGGASLDIGVHLMHEVRYLGGPIDRVYGVTRTFEPVRHLPQSADAVECDVDDAFFATLRFESGAVGQLTFTWAGHGSPTTMPDGLVVYGSRGCLKGGTLVLDDGSKRDALEVFEADADLATRERFFPFGLTDPFALAWLDLLRSIERGADPEASGEEGLLDLAAGFAIAESSALGCEVRLRDVVDGTVNTYQAEIDRHYGLL
jgi:1,5-anhydro-D-fructose reductase (1,5-anhydro-D-mannitol-forming)